MTYDTFSSSAPSNNTGILSAGLAKTISNNPSNVDAAVSSYPNHYDQFVNKTEGRSDIPIPVIAEPHLQSEVETIGSISFVSLNHAILRSDGGASVVVSDGTINLDATDYDNGILAFSVAPVGNFTVTYLGIQDALFGEHINALQNAVMNIQGLLGAGAVESEGIRNATVWVQDYPASAERAFPNAVHTQSLEENVSIKGEAGSSRTITLGNGNDSVIVDAKSFRVTSTDGSTIVTGVLGDSNQDVFFFNSPVAILATGGILGGLQPTGTYAAAAFSVGNPNQSTWTGASAGPYAKPSATAGVFPLARFYGDVHVIGDLFIQGSTQVFSSLTGAQVSQINDILEVTEDLRVSGNTSLNQNLTVGDNLTVNGYIDIRGSSNEISKINTPLFAQNNGNQLNGMGGPYSSETVPKETEYIADLPFHVGKVKRNPPREVNDFSINKHFHVDGLDPSYIAKLISFRAHDRKDWKSNTVNYGPYQGFTGTVMSFTAPGTNQWIDSGLGFNASDVIAWSTLSGFNPISGAGSKAFRWQHQGGSYYHGKFANESHLIPSGEYSGNYMYGDGNDWTLLYLSNNNASNNPGANKNGAKVPIKRITPLYSTGSPFLATGAVVELSRHFNTSVQTSDVYKIYHPYHSKPNAIRKLDSSTISVFASEAEPIIADVNGITKIVTTSCDHTITAGYTGFYFIYVDGYTPEIAKSFDGTLLESEGTVVVTTERYQSESMAPIGEFYAINPGAGIIDSSIITYRYATKYDTLWQRVNRATNVYASATNKEFSYRGYNTGITATSTGEIEVRAFFNNNEEWGDILVGGSNEYIFRVQHNFGSLEKSMNASLKLYVAPNYGLDYPSVSTATGVRMGPDYAYITELNRVVDNGSAGYEVIHVDRNFIDITLPDIATVTGAIIKARSASGARNLALTGSVASLTGVGVSNRERSWWYVRAIVE